MNDQKNPNGEIVLQGRFAKWFENYWYHYKWVTIGVAAAIVILLVCVLQTCSKKSEDIMLTYAGPTVLSLSELDDVSTVIGGVMPYDYDENGEKHVAWTTYQIYSEEQIRAEAETDEEGKTQAYVDRSFNTEQYQTYSSYLKTGETSIFLLDPWLYAELVAADRLTPLSEVTDTTPKGAIDDYGVRLGDTDLYAKYAVLRRLPADTVICLMKPYVIGKSSDEAAYAFACETFAAIVSDQNQD